MDQEAATPEQERKVRRSPHPGLPQGMQVQSGEDQGEDRHALLGTRTWNGCYCSRLHDAQHLLVGSCSMSRLVLRLGRRRSKGAGLSPVRVRGAIAASLMRYQSKMHALQVGPPP